MPPRWDTAGAYPAARERDPGAPAPGVEQFRRHEATQGFVTVGDTLADVLRFSGRPDSIEIDCETNDAVIVFTDRARPDEDTITIRAGQSKELRIAAEVVRARNVTAGFAASLQVVGKWQRR